MRGATAAVTELMSSGIIKDTIPIIYNGGSYGTFVEWALRYFSGSTDTLPFNENGNSHKFTGQLLIGMEGWRAYIASNQTFPLVRVHPKTLKEESLIDNIKEILNSVPLGILLYTEHDSVLLNLNNKFDKIWEGGWLEQNQKNFDENIKQWNVTSLDDMTVWQKREFMSFYLWDQHFAETEIDSVIKFDHLNLLKINIRDLFNKFEETIKNLLNYCSLPLVKTNFIEVYNQWVSLQRHAGKDHLVDQIVSNTISKIPYDWREQNLTIVDEAIIQMKLRNLHNLDLKCYNLNVFPTNTQDLRNLLIDVKPI